METLKVLDMFGDVPITNDDLKLVGNETSNELLDHMVLRICRGVSAQKAFKGGWMLTKLLKTKSRMTRDIDLSVPRVEDYEEIKIALQEIAQEFLSADIIDNYRLKESITPTSSGGIDFYKDGQKVLGADIGLHEISWGVKRYDLELVSLDAFKVERMLADKIIAILSRKRFRRTKDLYDFCILVRSFDFDVRELAEYVELRGGAEWNNIPFNDTVLAQYRKAWDKLELINSETGDELFKEDFDSVIELFYSIVLPLKAKSFVYPYWNHLKEELQRERF